MSDVIPDNGSRVKPIGIFDSGLGGLTVLKALTELLPSESTVYFGDCGRTPYGTKSRETILHYSGQDVSFLLSQDVKMIVIACGTSCSNAYTELAKASPVPVIGVIDPGAIAAVRASRNGRIGVIGTPATIASNVYEELIIRQGKSLYPDIHIEVYSQACPLFVGLAEEGWWDNEITYLAAMKYLTPLKEKGVDTLVLGCTHYPLLQPIISKVMGDDVVLINSADEVVKLLSAHLNEYDLYNTAAYNSGQTSLFFTSDSEEKFEALGSSFLKRSIDKATKIDIEAYKSILL